MAEIVLTIPLDRWDEFWTATKHHNAVRIRLRTTPPRIHPGERVWIVQHGRVQGFTTLYGIQVDRKFQPEDRPRYAKSKNALIKPTPTVYIVVRMNVKPYTVWSPRTDAPMLVKHFRGYRYRNWADNQIRRYPFTWELNRKIRIHTGKQGAQMARVGSLLELQMRAAMMVDVRYVPRFWIGPDNEIIAIILEADCERIEEEIVGGTDVQLSTWARLDAERRRSRADRGVASRNVRGKAKGLHRTED